MLYKIFNRNYLQSPQRGFHAIQKHLIGFFTLVDTNNQAEPAAQTLAEQIVFLELQNYFKNATHRLQGNNGQPLLRWRCSG